MLNKRYNKNVKRDAGYILVTVAVFLIVLLAFAALAVDIGIQYSARTQNQAAADAAALAGAFTFGNPIAAQPATAQNQAVQVAIANHTAQGTITSGQVTAVADVANRRVVVDITTTEPTFFSKVVGLNSAQVHTRAVAEAASQGSATPCTKPWFIPNTLGSTAPCGPGGNCATGNVLVNSSGNKTAYATSLLGNSYLMKPQSAGDAIAPSDFYAIDVSGANANDYRDDIGQCAEVQVSCQTSYNVKTGNMKGPTQQGVNNLIGNPPTDTYIGIGVYQHADGNRYDTSRALVTAPIVDLCGYSNFCPSASLPNGGNVWLSVKGFAQFFVEGVDQSNGPNQGNVTGRLINVIGCDPATPTSNGSVSGGGLPLRLVREP